MPKIRLTELSVRNAKPLATQYMLWDATLPNFGVRVSSGGTKNFTIMLGARRERISIGRFPIISLAEARAKAKELMAQRTLGQLQAKTVSFEEAFELFKETHCARLRPSTARSYKRVLAKHYLPRLRKVHLDEISTQYLLAITDKLLRTPAEQAHAQGVSRTFFRWAVRRQYLKHSPLEGMQITKLRSRDRYLNDEELVAVFNAAKDYGYAFGTIIQLLLLTGQRRGEVAAFRSDWIDFKEQTITIPAAVAKNGRQHTFPFGPLTRAIFEQCSSVDGMLFPARGHPGAAFCGWSTPKIILDRRLPNVAHWTLHDLRRTFATKHASIGTTPHITERLLNHVNGTISGVAAIYNRYAYRDEMREAANKFEKHVASLINPLRRVA